jgi:hypothetical protein
MPLQRFTLGALFLSAILVACSDGGDKTVSTEPGTAGAVDTSASGGPAVRGDDRSEANQNVWGQALRARARVRHPEGDPRNK